MIITIQDYIYMILLFDNILQRVYSNILTIQGWSEGEVVQILYAFVGPREGDGVGATEAGSS